MKALGPFPNGDAPEHVKEALVEGYNILCTPMDLCMNCRLLEPVGGTVLCKSCLGNAMALDRMLDEGISIEYADGAQQLLQKSNVSRRAVGLSFNGLVDQLKGTQDKGGTKE